MTALIRTWGTIIDLTKRFLISLPVILQKDSRISDHLGLGHQSIEKRHCSISLVRYIVVPPKNGWFRVVV